MPTPAAAPTTRPDAVAPAEEREGIPKSRPEPIPEGRRLPNEDGKTIGWHLAVKMEPGPFLETAEVMNEQCWDKVGTEASLSLLRSMLQTASRRGNDALLPLLKEFLAEFSTEV